MIAVIAGVLAIGLSFLALPFFNQLLDKPLSLVVANPWIWVGLAGFICCTGLLAGIYPAFVLSAFQPVKTFKGLTPKSKFTLSFREVLVVLQFGIAVVLIIATLIVRLQIRHAGERNVGYQTSQLLEIPIEGDADKNYAVIKSELLESGAVEGVTRTGWSITLNGSSSGGGFSWEGATPEQELQSFFILSRAESDYVSTIEIGRAHV